MRQKLSYHFHDPNPPEAAAANLLKVFIEAATDKARPHAPSAAGTPPGSAQTDDEGRPA